MSKILTVLSVITCSILISGCSLFEPEEILVTDISDYNKYFGDDQSHKNDMFPNENNIFPTELVESMALEEFVYYYYNPFDPNYLSLLVYSCSEEDYQEEVSRLQRDIESTEDYYIYGSTGFEYPVYAINANDYGLTYVLGDDEQSKLIYVELLFCNYFSDINYEEYIDPQYLPIGFDAMPDNTTRLAFEDNTSKQ